MQIEVDLKTNIWHFCRNVLYTVSSSGTHEHMRKWHKLKIIKIAIINKAATATVDSNRWENWHFIAMHVYYATYMKLVKPAQ